MGSHFSSSDVKVITSNHSYIGMDGSGGTLEKKMFSVAATKGGKVIPECLLGGEDNRESLYDYDSIEVDSTYEFFGAHLQYRNVKVEEAYLLHIQYWANFYHFMMELLPNMYYYKKTLLEKGCKIMVPTRNCLIDGCLEAFSIPDEMVINLKLKNLHDEKKRRCYSVSKFHYSSTASSPGNSDLQVEAFKSFQKQFIHTNDTTSPKKIYISRADKADSRFNNSATGKDRTISNESEVLNLMMRCGYEIHAVGTKTFEEKAKLLSNAETIVTPHGGNIINCCLAKNLKKLIILTYYHGQFCDNIFCNFIKALLPNVEVVFVRGTQDDMDRKTGRSSDGKIHSQVPFNIEVDELAKAISS